MDPSQLGIIPANTQLQTSLLVNPGSEQVTCGRGTIGLIWSCRRLTLYFKSRDMSVLRNLGLVDSFGGQRP